MSKHIFAAAFGMGVAACLAAPAHARLDHGPVASLYDQDGRKSLSRRSSSEKATARRTAGKTAKQRGKAVQYRKTARRNTGSGRNGPSVADRAVTVASRSGGGGGGASRSCLTSAARALLGRIESQFGAVQVISTCRPGARIAGSGKPSKHASGNAVDFNAGGRKQAIVAWLRANHTSGGTMTYARMSHIHVDIGPRFVSLGAGGGRRRG